MTDNLLKNEKLAKEILEKLRDSTKEVIWKPINNGLTLYHRNTKQLRLEKQ